MKDLVSIIFFLKLSKSFNFYDGFIMIVGVRFLVKSFIYFHFYFFFRTIKSRAMWFYFLFS